jgi:hypothetical protein
MKNLQGVAMSRQCKTCGYIDAHDANKEQLNCPKCGSNDMTGKFPPIEMPGGAMPGWRTMFWVATAAFVGVLAYVVKGALTGDLFVPGRGGSIGVHYSGLAAWIFVPVVFMLFLATLIGYRIIPHFAGLESRTRKVYSGGLIVGAVLLALLARYIDRLA